MYIIFSFMVRQTAEQVEQRQFRALLTVARTAREHAQSPQGQNPGVTMGTEYSAWRAKDSAMRAYHIPKSTVERAVAIGRRYGSPQIEET